MIKKENYEIKKTTTNESDAIYRNKTQDFKESNVVLMSFLNLSLTQLRALHCILSIRKPGDIFIKCKKNEFFKLAGIDKTHGTTREISAFKKIDPVVSELLDIQKSAIVKIPKEWFKNNNELYSKIYYLFHRDKNDTTPFDPSIHMLKESDNIDSNFMINLVSGIEISSTDHNIYIKLNQDSLPLLDEIQREYTLWYSDEHEELKKLTVRALKWYQFLRSKIGARQKELIYTVYLEPSPSNELNNVRYIVDALDMVEQKQPNGSKEWVYKDYPIKTTTRDFIKRLVEDQFKSINDANLMLKVHKIDTITKNKKIVAIKILIQNQEFINDPDKEKIQKYKTFMAKIMKVSDTTLLRIANIMESDEFAQRMNKEFFEPQKYEQLKELYLHFCLKYIKYWKEKIEIKNEFSYLFYMIKNGNDLWDGVRGNNPNTPEDFKYYWHCLPKKEILNNIKEIEQEELDEEDNEDYPF